MKRIDVIIPTRNRLTKLIRTLESIPKEAAGKAVNVTVVCDGDKETAKTLVAGLWGVSRVLYVANHSGSVYCRNLVTQAAEDAVLYATDDIQFHPGAIDEAVRCFEAAFPDDDGVVGFNQVNHDSFNRTGVALVGQTFLRRYQNRKLFYPKYFHFSCQEVERAAVSLGKMEFCEAAKLTHFHPGQNKIEVDVTHVEARKYRTRDREISMARKDAGIIWGING